jgi:hypothetical protein
MDKLTRIVMQHSNSNSVRNRATAALVTIGIDNTALTADCELNIIAKSGGGYQQHGNIMTMLINYLSSFRFN